MLIASWGVNENTTLPEHRMSISTMVRHGSRGSVAWFNIIKVSVVKSPKFNIDENIVAERFRISD